MLSRVYHQIGNIPKNIVNAPKKIAKSVANTIDDAKHSDKPFISNIFASRRYGGKRKTKKPKKSNRKTRKNRK